MKPPQCVGCPLYNSPGPVWGEGALDAPLYIIGQNPGPQEVEANRPFVGASGQVLNRTLQRAGISRASARVDNVAKCFVAPGKPVPPEAVRHCRDVFLQPEIRRYRPRVILTLGQEAFGALCTPKHLALVHTRQSARKDPSYWLAGAPYPHPEGPVIVGAAHPAFIIRTGFQLQPKFQRQVEQARRAIDVGVPAQLDVHTVYEPTHSEVVEYVQWMLSKPSGGCDIETPYTGEEDEDPGGEKEVILIGLAATDRDYIAVKPDQFSLLDPLFLGPTRHRLWCYGAQTELYHLGRLYNGCPGIQWADAMLAFHLLWPDEKSKDLGTAMSMYTLWGYHKNLEFRDPLWYNALDTVGCLETGEHCLDELRGFPHNMEPLFWSLMECVPQVLEWQHKGAPYDQDVSDRYELLLAKSLIQYETFWRAKFPTVDWQSPKQLVALFTSLGYKVPQKRRKKKDGSMVSTPTVDEEALEEIGKQSAVAKMVVMMRHMKKSSDFLNQAPDGRLRTRAKIHGQSGGRIQCVDKNIQQWPEEMALSPSLVVEPRKTVVPEHEDDLLVVADFSQIEFWLYAWYAHSKKLLEVKERGEYLYGQFYEDVWREPFFLPGYPRRKEYRDTKCTPPWKLLVAKSWPLGFIYGRGVPDTVGLPIDKQRSKEIWQGFHAANPEIGALHNRLMFTATKQGFLQTAFGRMRRFANPAAQRNQLLAFPGQSTACDVLVQKVILGVGVQLSREFGPRSRLYFTVHDSGIFNIQNGRRDPGIARQGSEFVKRIMESPIEALDGFSIPAEVKVGPSWGELMGVDKYEPEGSKAAV